MREVLVGLVGAVLAVAAAEAQPAQAEFPASCGPAKNLALTSEENRAAGFAGPLNRPDLVAKPFQIVGYHFRGNNALYEVAQGDQQFVVIGRHLARGSAGNLYASYPATEPSIAREVARLRHGTDAGAKPYNATGFISNVASGPLSGLNFIVTSCRT